MYICGTGTLVSSQDINARSMKGTLPCFSSHATTRQTVLLLQRTNNVMLLAKMAHCATNMNGIDCALIILRAPVCITLIFRDYVLDSFQRVLQHSQEHVLNQLQG
jgi:hypothetical protein